MLWWWWCVHFKKFEPTGVLGTGNWNLVKRFNQLWLIIQPNWLNFDRFEFESTVVIVRRYVKLDRNP